jgi:hypothetical protein
VLTAALSFAFASCSKSTGNNLQVKSSTTGEKIFAIKSGYAFPVTKTFTDTAGKVTTAAIYKTYVASYDLDAGNFSMTLDKPLTGDDQLRVVLSLAGEQGGNEKTPPKAGTYSARADKFMKVEDVLIVSRKGGGENKFWLDRSTLSGDVKVTSASATSISGDIDLTAGDNAIKGSFTAKVLARK